MKDEQQMESNQNGCQGKFYRYFFFFFFLIIIIKHNQKKKKNQGCGYALRHVILGFRSSLSRVSMQKQPFINLLKSNGRASLKCSLEEYYITWLPPMQRDTYKKNSKSVLNNDNVIKPKTLATCSYLPEFFKC